MDFIGTIVSGGLGLLSGGLTGLLGVGLQRFFDWMNAREQRKTLELKQVHEIAVIRANAEVMAQEWAARTRVAEVEAAGREAVADAQAFGKSFDLEPTRYSEGLKPPTGGAWAKAVQGAGWLLMVLLDVLRGMIRPGLTLYLAWIATKMYDQAQAALTRIDPDVFDAMMPDVYKGLVFTLLYLFTTCGLWWFGTRNKQPAPRVG